MLLQNFDERVFRLTIRKRLLVELYLHKLKTRLQYPQRARKDEIKGQREIIENAVEYGEDDVKTMQDMYNLFGTPQKLAGDLMDFVTEEETIAFQKERKIKMSLLFICILMILLCFLFAIYSEFSDKENKILLDAGPETTYISEEGQE